MQTAPVNRILRSSIVDGPGNRAVVFVQGCNYNCLYCHNPETIRLCQHCGECISRCPVAALAFAGGKVAWHRERCTMCDACIKACRHDACPRVRELTAADVMAEIETAVPFIRGLTVSGGECTLYPDFLYELSGLAHERGLTCFFDSNGSFDFQKFPMLLDRADGIMLDIKAVDGYRNITGSDNPGVLGRAVLLAERGKLHEVRTVIVPNLMDASETVRAVCEAIAPVDNRVAYKLIQYRPAGVRAQYAATLEAPDDALMEKLAGIVRSYAMTPVVI